MKTIHIFIFVFVTFLSVGKSNGQSADEVIDKYLNAIGGKEKIKRIKSLYTEGIMLVMSTEGKTRMTVLNGKGMRQEAEIMSQTQVTCMNEKTGWVINPFQGNPEPTIMPVELHNILKAQLTIGSPFVNYLEDNQKVESAGNEVIGGINAIELKMIKGDNTFTTFYFDPTSFLLIRTVQKLIMQGKEVVMTLNFSNYKDAGNGYLIPFNTKTDMGNGMSVSGSISKVEVDKAVDPTIFNKP